MASINYYSSFTGRKLSKYGVFTGPNTGNYGPEKTPHLDTFHSMLIWYLHRRIGWMFYISSYHGKKSSKFPDVAVGCQNRKLTYTFLVSKICENGLFLGWYLLDQSQQWKYQNNVWNLFTVFTANLRTHFTHCSGVYFVGLEQVKFWLMQVLMVVMIPCRMQLEIDIYRLSNTQRKSKTEIVVCLNCLFPVSISLSIFNIFIFAL